MYEAQISFSIVGSDDGRWVGCAFADTYFNDNDKNFTQSDFAYEGSNANEDPIASDGKLDANCPIMNPRAYFLTIFRIRSDQVLKEWEYLVREVERNIETHVW